MNKINGYQNITEGMARVQAETDRILAELKAAKQAKRTCRNRHDVHRRSDRKWHYSNSNFGYGL